MIYTEETLKDIKTPSQVKYALKEDSYFFSRKTMKFFGDNMTSFGIKTIDGMRIMYRKPSAWVNVFGTRKQAGRDFFGAWQIIPKNDHLDIQPLTEKQKESVYNQINPRSNENI